ncbi:hypothetical protein HGRIS_008257 [Hohenbuehelia grisea]|uniref:DUF6535 domain-containing protein n=1 Tax=Hohenbuehelia grisea TaxID=104357 RepID=A0ABR3J7E4_9AGAR
MAQPLCTRRRARSLDARCRKRQQKLFGIDHWHFRGVIELLPLLLQASLLLFGVGMSSFIWIRHRTIGTILIAATSVGVLLYITTTIAALLSPHCPFQTPLATQGGVLWRAVLKHLKSVNRLMMSDIRSTLRHIRRQHPRLYPIAAKLLPPLLSVKYILQRPVIKLWRAVQYVARTPTRIRTWVDDNQRREFIDAHPTTSQMGQSSFNRSLHRNVLSLRYMLGRLHRYFISHSSTSVPITNFVTLPTALQPDAITVLWILETVTEPTTTVTAMQMVPEVDWPQELDVFPLFCQLSASFADLLSSNQIISRRSEMSDHAAANAKALTHLFIERLSSGDDLLDKLRIWNYDIWSRLRRDWLYPSLNTANSPANSTRNYDLINMYGSVVATNFSQSLYAGTITSWKAHLIPLTIIRPKGAEGFMTQGGFEYLCRLLGTPMALPSPILTDLLVAAGLVSGMRFAKESLLKLDKSQQLHLMLEAVFHSIQSGCTSTSPAVASRSLALLRLVHPIYVEQRRDAESSADSYALWCLLLSRHLASRRPRTPSMRSPSGDSAAINVDAMMALRLSLENAGGYSSSLANTHGTEGLWNMSYIHYGSVHFGSMPFSFQNAGSASFEWLLGFAYVLKCQHENAIDIDSSNSKEFQYGVADALLALSGLICSTLRIDMDLTNSHLLEILCWSLGTDQPTYLRNTSLKLLRDLLGGLQYRLKSREDMPLRPAFVHRLTEDFFACLAP